LYNNILTLVEPKHAFIDINDQFIYLLTADFYWFPW